MKHRKILLEENEIPREEEFVLEFTPQPQKNPTQLCVK